MLRAVYRVEHRGIEARAVREDFDLVAVGRGRAGRARDGRKEVRRLDIDRVFESVARTLLLREQEGYDEGRHDEREQAQKLLPRRLCGPRERVQPAAPNPELEALPPTLLTPRARVRLFEEAPEQTPRVPLLLLLLALLLFTSSHLGRQRLARLRAYIIADHFIRFYV